MKKTKRPSQLRENVSISPSPFLLLLFAFLCAMVTYFVYLPIKHNRFTNWDDDRYITGNKDIQQKLDKKNLKVLLSKNYEGNYHPVTMLSYALNYSRAKLQPQAYLYTNLFFHIANTLLVFMLAWMLSRQPVTSFITSLLFGIHPLHVESVAWASERKDVLYCFFFLLSLICYIRYRSNSNYLLFAASLLLFVLSLLSKAMAVPLAGVIILVDLLLLTSEKPAFEKNIQPAVGIKKLFLIITEKIPFFTAAVVAGITAIHAQQVKTFIPQAVTGFSVLERCALASHALLKYILLLLAPHRLSAFYPYPETVSTIHWICLAAVILILIMLTLFIFRKYPLSYFTKLHLFGFFFFLANLILVLQLLPVGEAIMADRYTYVSSIGFFLMIALGANMAYTRFAGLRTLLYTITAVYVLWLSWFAYDRCKVWRDSITLWDDVIARHPGLALALNNRGLAKQHEGDMQGAYEDYRKATEANPAYDLAWNNMGSIKAQQNQQEEAIRYFSKAISLNPDRINAYSNRARSKAILGDHKGAVEDFSRYLQADRENPDVYNDRGLEEYHLKEYSKAIPDFTKAIELGEKYKSPRMHYYYLNRGLSKAFSNDLLGAFDDYHSAISIEPNYPQAYLNLGILELYTGKKEEGCRHLQQAKDAGLPEAAKNHAQYCQ